VLVHGIHYTPKHGSWLNQIEIWFGVVQKRVIRRGNFVSKADLTRRILAYIALQTRQNLSFWQEVQAAICATSRSLIRKAVVIT
jgi:hypothetical protein